MKKVNIIAVLLFCVAQNVHATQPSPNYTDNVEVDNVTESFWKDTQAVLAGSIICVTGLLIGMGIQSYRNNNELLLQLEQKKLAQAKLEKENDQQKATFHCINGIKRLMQEFKSIQEAYPKPEQYNDVQQKQILEMVLAGEGLVTTFEKKIELYTEQYNNLDPETALLNQPLLTDLHWLRRMLNTNNLAKVKKEQEIKQAFELAKRQAEVTKVEAEARMTQNLEKATQDTKKLVASTKSCVNRTVQQLIDHLLIIESTLNRRLAELSNEQTTIKSHNSTEHKQSMSEIKKLEQLIQSMAQEIAALKQSLQQPIIPPPYDYYPPTEPRPPAFNPEWNPYQQQ